MPLLPFLSFSGPISHFKKKERKNRRYIQTWTWPRRVGLSSIRNRVNSRWYVVNITHSLLSPKVQRTLVPKLQDGYPWSALMRKCTEKQCTFFFSFVGFEPTTFATIGKVAHILQHAFPLHHRSRLFPILLFRFLPDPTYWKRWGSFLVWFILGRHSSERSRGLNARQKTFPVELFNCR